MSFKDPAYADGQESMREAVLALIAKRWADFQRFASPISVREHAAMEELRELERLVVSLEL